MRIHVLLGLTLPLLAVLAAGFSPSAPVQTADVAVAPFSVADDSAGVLRATADSCLERLVAGLKAKGIAVARYPKLDEKKLAAAKPVPWAVLGQLTRAKGVISAELRLMEVASGDEMVSYFNSGNAPAIVTLGGTAAGRIATFVKEKKGIGPP